ncbi:hypothetical protein [Streptomyces brasiliscabiei]|uniref:hypothetical protein n=1 Tax=Streptomyces brasiliscabiei TaxID=2736302 RepID=UPI0038F7D181
MAPVEAPSEATLPATSEAPATWAAAATRAAPVPPAAPVLRGRDAGSVRRWTAGDAAGALVRGVGRWGERGGTGVTRGPVGRDGATWWGAR